MGSELLSSQRQSRCRALSGSQLRCQRHFDRRRNRRRRLERCRRRFEDPGLDKNWMELGPVAQTDHPASAFSCRISSLQNGSRRRRSAQFSVQTSQQACPGTNIIKLYLL